MGGGEGGRVLVCMCVCNNKVLQFKFVIVIIISEHTCLCLRCAIKSDVILPCLHSFSFAQYHESIHVVVILFQMV